MPPVPSRERAEMRRAKVIDATRKLFSEKGFHATGMAEIATASGVKVGQIYRDFASKEAIVAAIVEADFSAFIRGEALEEAIESRDRTGVRRVIEAMFEARPADRMMPEILAEASRNARVAEIIEALEARFAATLDRALSVFAAGEGARPQRAALTELLMTLVIGWCNRVVSPPRAPRRALPDTIRHLIAREIAALEAMRRVRPSSSESP